MVDYGDLKITISVDTKTAKSNVGNLTASLDKLNEKAKELDKAQINEVKKIMQDIANIDFSNVAKGLDDVVKAFKQLNSVSGKANKGKSGLGSLTGDIDAERVNDVSNVLSKEMPKFDVNTFGNFDVNGALSEYKDTLTEINEKLKGWKVSLDDLNNSGNQSSSVFTKLSQVFKVLSVPLKKAHDGFSKLATQFFRIVRYRIMRKIIQEIYKALQEATAQVVELDSNFAVSYNRILNSLAYVGNATMSILDPIIQMITPLLETVADLVGDVANELGRMFAELNGQNGYAKAIKGAKDYASELKKTQSIGIDELNVLGNAQDQNFEMVDMLADESEQSGLKSFIQTIGDLVTGIIKDIVPLLKPIIDLLDTVLNVVNLIVQAISKPLHTILGSLVGVVSKVVELVTELLEVLTPIIEGLLTIIQPVLEYVASLIARIFDVVGWIFDAFKWGFEITKPFANFFARVLKAVGIIFELVKGIAQSILAIFTFDWGNLGNIWNGVEANINSYASGSFATGGFPEDGLFFANHGELVGQFSNGKTAVANNEEITEGIYQAVLQAMRESGSGGITIEMDGYRVAQGVTNRQDNMQNIIKGGTLVYGK